MICSKMNYLATSYEVSMNGKELKLRCKHREILSIKL